MLQPEIVTLDMKVEHQTPTSCISFLRQNSPVWVCVLVLRMNLSQTRLLLTHPPWSTLGPIKWWTLLCSTEGWIVVVAAPQLFAWVRDCVLQTDTDISDSWLLTFSKCLMVHHTPETSPAGLSVKCCGTVRPETSPAGLS